MSKAVMKRVLEALERVNASPHLQDLHHAFDEEINDLKQAVAEPEQEPVARAWQEGYNQGIEDERISEANIGIVGFGAKVEPARQNPYQLTAPTPQREHITDGSPCWCNPDVIEEDGGNVIVHNYDDNWQQYAKPGETAQQCIERHRSEQDALMKLYATPRKPLTEEEIEALWQNTSPYYDHQDFARAIERAHGIGEQT